MIQCNRCNLQYIGETKRRLKDRFNEHRRTIDNPNTKSKPTTAAEHFLSSPNHTANDMQLIPFEKVFSNRDSIRKAKEAFLISKGRTLVPHGFNIREKNTNYLVSYFLFPFIVFFLFYVIIVIFLSFLSFWVEPYVFPLLRKHFTYKAYQCKFYLIVPEEGWFGQPKYSTPSKISLTLYRSLLLYFYLLNRLDH